MKIASWNVNSLGVRLPQVIRWLQSNPVDVLALQETKTTDADFPREAFDEIGYHCVFSGQPAYNGVALISRAPGEDVQYTMPGVSEDEKRVLEATYDGVRVLNWYVVNGQQAGTEKYDRKIAWLKAAAKHIKQQTKRHPELLVVGDFNIIPEDADAHRPEEWRKTILATPAEREEYEALLGAGGVVDTFRIPRLGNPAEVFSWWPYWRGSFRRNSGARIDLILATPPMADACTLSAVDKEPRGWERPSDHAPVVAEFHADRHRAA